MISKPARPAHGISYLTFHSLPFPITCPRASAGFAGDIKYGAIRGMRASCQNVRTVRLSKRHLDRNWSLGRTAIFEPQHPHQYQAFHTRIKSHYALFIGIPFWESLWDGVRTVLHLWDGLKCGMVASSDHVQLF
jgi:hypothetical protein